jgi:hypothetical protein
MKKGAIFLILIISCNLLFSQSPSIQETLDYINTIMRNNPCDWGMVSSPDIQLKSSKYNQRCNAKYYEYFSLSGDGNIVIYRHIEFYNCLDNIDNGNQRTAEYCTFHNRDIIISSIVINEYNRIILKGRNSAKIFKCGERIEKEFELCEYSDSYDTQRCLKAIKHLFTLLQNDSKYSRNKINDPFAPDNSSPQEFQSNIIKSNSQTPPESNNIINYINHFLAVPKKYIFQGINSKETLELKYKNPQNNITYYLTSYQLPPNTNIGYYLDAFKENQKKDGFSTSEIIFQGKKAILGKMQIQTAYIYQLHFVNINKGQTIQMLAGKASDAEFETFMNDIKIIK